MNPVTFQINLAPGDYRHSKRLLEFQIATFHNQVGEILLTYDRNPQKVLSEDELNNYHIPFVKLVNNLKLKYPKVKFDEVDYTTNVVEQINRKYFNRNIATHDFRGAPIYAYMYGFEKSKYDYVFHIDSDMFFGGLSQTWISEAIELFKEDSNIGFVSPLPGPPHPDKILLNQKGYANYKGKDFSFLFTDSVSTRVVLFNKSVLIGSLQAKLAPFKESVFALLSGFSPSERLEQMIYFYMKNNNLIRVDFLGNKEGLYSLHPDYRSANFYTQIDAIIERLKNNKNIPESQLGVYNFTEDFIDWGDAFQLKEKNRLRNKLFKSK